MRSKKWTKRSFFLVRFPDVPLSISCPIWRDFLPSFARKLTPLAIEWNSFISFQATFVPRRPRLLMSDIRSDSFSNFWINRIFRDVSIAIHICIIFKKRVHTCVVFAVSILATRWRYCNWSFEMRGQIWQFWWKLPNLPRTWLFAMASQIHACRSKSPSSIDKCVIKDNYPRWELLQGDSSTKT